MKTRSQTDLCVKIIEVCYRCGVKVLTVYAFAVDNFKRSRYEVDSLMSLMKLKLTQLSEHGELFQQYGTSVRILGQRELLGADVIEAIDRAEELTKDNDKAILNICFPYASRDEMTKAVRETVEEYSHPVPEREWAFSQSEIEHKIRARNLSASPHKIGGNSPSPSAVSDTEESTIESVQPATPPNFAQPLGPKGSNCLSYPDPESINNSTLDDHMYTAGMPPVDLFIRTSGVERFSDFMLWQTHEDTEIKFVPCMWPEFDLWHFLPVLLEWQWKRRKQESEGKFVRRRKDRRVSKKAQ